MPVTLPYGYQQTTIMKLKLGVGYNLEMADRGGEGEKYNLSIWDVELSRRKSA